MGDIISLDDKLQEARDRKGLEDRKRKLSAIRTVMQRTGRPPRCEKCLQKVPPEVLAERDEAERLRVPYIFCESCSEDYVDYIEFLQGREKPDRYWHNGAWRDLWRSWIDYQGSVDRYTKTPEFKQLLEELKAPDSDQ
jgi:hypothetical protein